MHRPHQDRTVGSYHRDWRDAACCEPILVNTRSERSEQVVNPSGPAYLYEKLVKSTCHNVIIINESEK